MSQTSNSSLEPGLSQETFNDLFNTIGQIINPQDLQGIQTDYQMASPSLHMVDENMHENLELKLECVNVQRHEQGEFSSYIPDQNFSQGSYKPEEIGVKQHAIVCKQEHLSNGLKSSPSPEQSSPQPLIVSNTDFPGRYCFDIGYEEEKVPVTKSVHWTYSPYLDKLFLKMRVIVPFRIKLQGYPSLQTASAHFIRAVVIYRQPEYYRENVERCPNHITKHKDGHHAPKHLLRCENPQTTYVTCPVTGRHCLTIPLGKPQGKVYMVVVCFLFHTAQFRHGKVKGREKYELLLKIKESLDLMDLVPQAQIDKYRQSCPPCGRLKNSQNMQHSENGESQNSNDSQAVKGREKYELLLKIKESLDLMDLVPQAQIDKYRQSCPPCGRLKNSQNMQHSENGESQNSNDSQADEVDGPSQSFSQLSRSDSGSSYHSPTSSQQSTGSGGGGAGINAVRFTLRRTLSLEKKGHFHVGVP
ncbi:PREDICTED: tumor protein 63-like [Acropora digitifera]|uniref:tumor protein 63-like n=1 Tax=Acropora digitifera TaxID=70779 RepID=UPI000779FFAC|nr:PREDICTED: tumor protein 63-like [Acropora digitifera]